MSYTNRIIIKFLGIQKTSFVFEFRVYLQIVPFIIVVVVILRCGTNSVDQNPQTKPEL